MPMEKDLNSLRGEIQQLDNSIRFASIANNLGSLVATATEMALLLPAGDAKLSFIDARDVAAVAVKALTGDSQEVREKNIINCFRQIKFVNMLNLKKADAQHDSDDSWCTLLIDNNKITAKIRHIGRGKFRILATQSGDKYINNVVDASDVFSCKRE